MRQWVLFWFWRHQPPTTTHGWFARPLTPCLVPTTAGEDDSLCSVSLLTTIGEAKLGAQLTSASSSAVNNHTHQHDMLRSFSFNSFGKGCQRRKTFGSSKPVVFSRAIDDHHFSVAGFLSLSLSRRVWLFHTHVSDMEVVDERDFDSSLERCTRQHVLESKLQPT
jgi:hypothetical protein